MATGVPTARQNLRKLVEEASGKEFAADKEQDKCDLDRLNEQVDALKVSSRLVADRNDQVLADREDISLRVRKWIRNMTHVNDLNSCLCKLMFVFVLIIVAIGLYMLIKRPHLG